MPLRNLGAQYGSISKLLHWGIVFLVIIQFYLAYWTIWMLPKESPLTSFYIDGLHKPIGVLMLGIFALAFLWKLMNPHPSFPLHMRKWEIFSARLTHILLYLGLLVMPITGIVMSVAAGYPPNFLGFQFPMLIAKNPAIAELFFNIHKITALTLIALVVIHILAALKHHFIDKDNVLKRMLPGTSNSYE